MRRYQVLSLAVVGLTLLSACSGGASKSAKGSGSTTLVVLQPALAKGLDPDGPNASDPATIEVFDNAYARLLDFGTQTVNAGAAAPDYKSLTSGLATSWTQTGPLTWTFKLRSGVKSCAGNTLTSADLVYTFSRANSVSGASPVTWFVGNVGGILSAAPLAPNATADAKKLHGEVTAIDPNTVQVKLQHADSLFPGILTNAFELIFDSKTVQAHATAADPWAHTWVQNNTAGFGAYCLTNYTPGTSLTYTANPGYYQKPHFTKVIVQAVPSDANRLTALETGSAQIATALTPSEYKSAASGSRTSVIGYYGQNSLLIQASYNFAPFSLKTNALVRQAIAYALPYSSIINNVYFGNAKPMLSEFPEGNIGVAAVSPYSTNLDKAKSLLAQAGFPNGSGLDAYAKGLSLYYATEDSSVLQPAALLIQSSLAQIGLRLTLMPITQSELYSRLLTKRDIPMVLDDHQVPIYPDADYGTQLDFVTAAKGGVNNNIGYSSATIDSGQAEALSMPNGAARDAKLQQIQTQLLNDLPWIPIALTKEQIGVSKGVTNWVGQPIGLLYSAFTAS